MTNVIYANARAKSLEKNLITKDKFVKLADADGAESSLSMLRETGFGDCVQIDSPVDFEKLIDAEIGKFFGFLEEVCPVKGLIEIFKLKYEFDNAQALIKSKYLKINPDYMLCEYGITDLKKAKEDIFADKYEDFYPELKQALVKCDDVFTSGAATGAKIDGIFSVAYYLALRRLSKVDKIFEQAFECVADKANVSLALRSRDVNLVKENFIKGGSVPFPKIIALAEMPFDMLLKENFGKRTDAVKVAVREAEKKKPLFDFEKICDGFILECLNENKYDVSGARPFIAYCYYKKIEMENVRIVLSGKVNGISAEHIKGRLRKSYER